MHSTTRFGFFVSFLSMLVSSLVLGQGNGADFYMTTEAQLSNSQYVQGIEDFYDNGAEGLFKGMKAVDIYFKIFRQPNAGSSAIVISSGRTEAAVKYKELVRDLFENGYSVYILDHRGQGQSGRMTADPDMGYVEVFQYYIDDLKEFFDDFVRPGQHTNHFLLAHSMGGAIGMSYLQQFPEDFDAAAFSSPMLGLKGGICSGARFLKPRRPTYGLGEGPYEEEEQVFAKNTLTGSKIRFDRMVKAFEEVPEARLGGATYQWVVASCDQFDFMNDHIDQIQTPFILFSAEDEKIVSLKAHRKFIKKAVKLGKDCDRVYIKNARHELLIEKDPQREKTISRTLSFFAQYTK